MEGEEGKGGRGGGEEEKEKGIREVEGGDWEVREEK